MALIPSDIIMFDILNLVGKFSRQITSPVNKKIRKGAFKIIKSNTHLTYTCLSERNESEFKHMLYDGYIVKFENQWSTIIKLDVKDPISFYTWLRLSLAKYRITNITLNQPDLVLIHKTIGQIKTKYLEIQTLLVSEKKKCIGEVKLLLNNYTDVQKIAKFKKTGKNILKIDSVEDVVFDSLDEDVIANLDIQMDIIKKEYEHKIDEIKRTTQIDKFKKEYDKLLTEEKNINKIFTEQIQAYREILRVAGEYILEWHDRFNSQ